MANALGIARGAIESFITLATCTSSTGSPTLLRERPFVQTRVAEAEAILSAARAYVVDAVGTAWEAVCAGAPDLSRVIAQARLAITHGMHEAVRIFTWPCSIMPRFRRISNQRVRCSWGCARPTWAGNGSRPFLCASVASACGSQQVISMARYISIAVESAAGQPGVVQCHRHE